VKRSEPQETVVEIIQSLRSGRQSIANGLVVPTAIARAGCIS